MTPALPPDLPLSDAQRYAALLQASYTAAPTMTSGESFRAILTPGDVAIVCVPGTRETDLQDWVTDLDALPHPSITHPQLGEVHRGCQREADAAYPAFRELVRNRPWGLVAHSLGGGIGVLLAAMATLDGWPPSFIFTCGAMRVSIGRRVPEILKDVSGWHLVNGRDPVPDLPPELFTEWRGRTQLGSRGLVNLRIEDHLMGAYVAALAG